MSDEALEELKKCFLEAYDDNNDGKIDIREVTIMIKTKINFKNNFTSIIQGVF